MTSTPPEPSGPSAPDRPEEVDEAGMNFASLLSSAQDAMAAQAEAADTTVEGTAGGGVVRVKMSGVGEVTAVHIDPGVVDPGEVEMLQDLIVAAIRDAAAQAAALQQEAFGALGNLDLDALTGSIGDLFGGGPGGGGAPGPGPGR